MNTVQTVLALIEPHILELLGGLIALIIARLSTVASRRWGLEIDARHRDALHSALMTGISFALQRGLRGGDAVDVAIDYAKKSVPDAIKRFSPVDEVIRALAESKIPKA